MSTDPSHLLDVDPAGVEPPESETVDAEEYRPDPPRPDLVGAATEADVADQAIELPQLLDDEGPAPDADAPHVTADDTEG